MKCARADVYKRHGMCIITTAMVVPLTPPSGRVSPNWPSLRRACKAKSVNMAEDNNVNIVHVACSTCNRKYCICDLSTSASLTLNSEDSEEEEADDESSSSEESEDFTGADAVAYYMKERERVLGPSEGSKFNWTKPAPSDLPQVQTEKSSCEEYDKFTPSATSSPGQKMTPPRPPPRGHLPHHHNTSWNQQSPVVDRLVYTGVRDWEIGNRMSDLIVISVKITQTSLKLYSFHWIHIL